MKERLLLKKDREQRGREKEGEAPRKEDISQGEAESGSLTVESRSESEISEGVCVWPQRRRWAQVTCVLSVDRFRWSAVGNCGGLVGDGFSWTRTWQVEQHQPSLSALCTCVFFWGLFGTAVCLTRGR